VIGSIINRPVFLLQTGRKIRLAFRVRPLVLRTGVIGAVPLSLGFTLTRLGSPFTPVPGRLECSLEAGSRGRRRLLQVSLQCRGCRRRSLLDAVEVSLLFGTQVERDAGKVPSQTSLQEGPQVLSKPVRALVIPRRGRKDDTLNQCVRHVGARFGAAQWVALVHQSNASEN
jgi:hypothetical protein